MSIFIELEKNIHAVIKDGKIKITGLKNLSSEEQQEKLITYKNIMPEIENRLYYAAIKKIRSTGAMIHKDCNGIAFNPSVSLEAAKEAWEAFLDIRPVMLKKFIV